MCWGLGIGDWIRDLVADGLGFRIVMVFVLRVLGAGELSVWCGFLVSALVVWEIFRAECFFMFVVAVQGLQFLSIV